MYIAYYYDPENDINGGDLSVNGEYFNSFTSKRSSDILKDLQPKSETEELILLVPNDHRLKIKEFNAYSSYIEKEV